MRCYWCGTSLDPDFRCPECQPEKGEPKQEAQSESPALAPSTAESPAVSSCEVPTPEYLARNQEPRVLLDLHVEEAHLLLGALMTWHDRGVTGIVTSNLIKYMSGQIESAKETA